jgi:hypothetical protein
MRLPIDTTKLTILSIGEPQPSLEYGTRNPKLTADGRPVIKVPVLLSGMGERVDPTSMVTITGPIPEVKSGQALRFQNLTASTWTIRDTSGRERSGITLRADAIEVDSKQAR